MKARAGMKMFYVNCKMKIIYKKKDTASIHWSENNFKSLKENCYWVTLKSKSHLNFLKVIFLLLTKKKIIGAKIVLVVFRFIN